MSVFYWHTCRVAVGSRVTSSLDQVSYFYGPHGMTIIPHMSFFYSTTCLNFVRPRVSILLGHMSCPELPTRLFFDSTTWQDGFVPRIWFVLAHVSCPSTYTCHSLVCRRVRFLFNDVSCVGSTTCIPIITSKKIFLDLHYCTK